MSFWQPIRLRYRNYRGEVSVRLIQPMIVRHGATEWHPEPCWLLHAWDFDRKAFRDFALSECDFSAAAIEAAS